MDSDRFHLATNQKIETQKTDQLAHIFFMDARLKQVFENLLGLIHQYLIGHELLILLSVSKCVRSILILSEDVGYLRNRSAKSVPIALGYSSVCDWPSCYSWMSLNGFTICPLIIESPEQALNYFNSQYCGNPSGDIIPAHILYRGPQISSPVLAFADNEFLRNEYIFSRCAKDCFSSLYEGNVACNLCCTTREVSVRNAVLGDLHHINLVSTRTLQSVYLCRKITNLRFQSYLDLQSVALPEGLTSVRDNSFQGCSSLTSVRLPKGLTNVGYGAFADCSSLTSVTLPEGLTTVGTGAFAGCSSLTSVTLV